MSKKKNLNNVVEDIYGIISALPNGKEIDIPEEMLETFGKDMSEALQHWATPQNQEGKPGLRMSNIGRPSRRLWFDINSTENREQENPASLYIKFLYGHLLEVLVLFFVKLAGYQIDSQQKEVNVSGIKGHMDCKINGEVVDVKTASGYAFKKFREGTLAEDDAFGYLAQLAGYEEAEQTNKGGFLVLNKETGELVFFRPEDLDKPNIKDRIKTLKRDIKRKPPPIFCYTPVPEGKSGNLKLPRDCTWCPHKYECHKEANNGNGLRTFKYAKGNVYLTHVEKLPNVEEIMV